MEQNYNQVALSSEIKLRRNLDGYNFVNKISLSDSEEILKGINNVYGEYFSYRKLINVPTDKCNQLIEEEIISEDLLSNRDISAYAISENGEEILEIFEQDHLVEKIKKEGLDLEDAYGVLSQIDDQLLNNIPVCYDKDRGFLTANPKLIGTAMTVQIKLFLPGLVMSKKIQSLQEKINAKNSGVLLCKQDKYQDDCIYELSNIYTLGITEENIIQLVKDKAQEIIAEEKKAREILLNLSFNVLQDKVNRSYGILTNAYIMSLREAQTELSSLMFGLTCGIIKLKNGNNYFELFKGVKRYHLCEYFNKDIAPNVLDRYRADYLREKLRNKLVEI